MPQGDTNNKAIDHRAQSPEAKSERPEIASGLILKRTETSYPLHPEASAPTNTNCSPSQSGG